jgi:ABC-type antimicrobial peptide transport system permease subunit
VLRLILQKACLYLGLGLALGSIGALGLSRYVESELFGVTARDPGVFALAAGFLALAVLLAAFLPALQASRVNPMDALRSE